MKHATVTFKASTQARNMLALGIMSTRLYKKTKWVGLKNIIDLSFIVK